MKNPYIRLSIILLGFGYFTLTPVSAGPGVATLNVDVVNRPNVNVANTVGVTGTVAVSSGNMTVGNSPAAPVPVRDVDNPTRQPFTFQQIIEIPPDVIIGRVTFTVPENKRLVIEQVSVRDIEDRAVESEVEAEVHTSTGGQEFRYYFPATPSVYWVASSQVRCYADAGTTVLVGVVRDPGVLGAEVEFNVSGYLVNMP